MFVNSGQLNPYPLYLVLVLDSSSLHAVGPVHRTLAIMMAGQKGKRGRGNSNTDKTRLLLRAANGTIVISFLVYAASRATLYYDIIIEIMFHVKIQFHVQCKYSMLE